MKKPLVFIALGFFFSAFRVYSATSITLTPVAVATALNFSAGATNLKVADIYIDWDAAPIVSKTYNVYMSSQYSGFRHSDGLGSVISYSLRYKGTTKVMNNSNQLFYTFTVTAPGLAGSTTDPVELTYTGIPFASLYSGTYSDLVTITYESL